MTWRDRLARRIPLLLAAGAAWLTGGVVSPIGTHAADRLAALPPVSIGLAFLLAAMAFAYLPVPAARLRPLYLSVLLWLPWLPLPIPAAFLVWHGPLAWMVWAVITALVLAPVGRAWWSRLLAIAPAKQVVVAVLLGAIAYTAAAWRMAPVLPGGDEPHYLVIAESLLYDGDLKIENNHRRGDYHAYIGQELKPDYLRRGADGEIYSIHAPGLSALVLPAFAVAGYPGVVVFLSIVSALGAALMWRAGWRLTGDPAAAWAGWAAVAMSVPFFFQAFTVYPDGPAAVIVMTGAYALAFPDALAGRTSRIVAHGGALGALPWLHTRYAVLAGAIGVLIVLRLGQAGTGSRGMSRAALAAWFRRCAAFLVIPAVSAAAWLWSFYAIYGEWNPAAPYGSYTQSSLANAGRGLAGLLIDQQFGVLPNAPVYLIALAGLRALWHRNRRLALELVAVIGPYAVAVACYHMWWGGHSSPARFIVPVLLPFGMAAAVAWSRGSARGRATFAVLLGASVGLTAALVWVDRGALVYNVRDGFSRWMDAAAPLVNLPRAVPTLFRNSPGDTARIAAAWAAAGATSWRLLGHRDGATVVRRWLALACTVMLGATFGWRIAAAPALESGTGLVRVARVAAIRGTVITLPALRRETAAEALLTLRLPSALRRDRTPDGLLFVGRELPAGQYRVVADGQPVLAGTLEATVGRRTAPLLRTALDARPPGPTPMVLDLPAGAQVLTITGDEAARRSLDAVSLRIDAFSAVDGTAAHTVARYGEALVWFLDEAAFAEPQGWWVRGRASSAVLLDTHGGATGRLLIRNGGAANRVGLRAGAWTVTVNLAAGEERPISVPLAAGRARLVVTSDAAFRPSDVDPTSRDRRVLGVWVELR